MRAATKTAVVLWIFIHAFTQIQQRPHVVLLFFALLSTVVTSALCPIEAFDWCCSVVIGLDCVRSRFVEGRESELV